jgi:hypothetical protein
MKYFEVSRKAESDKAYACFRPILNKKCIRHMSTYMEFTLQFATHFN